jgi:hypothetical protein
MAKRKPNKPEPADSQEDLGALYAKLRAEFTAADLQKYTEVEEGIPAEQVLAEMEAIHRQETQRHKKA